MIDRYKFKVTDEINCFEDREHTVLCFPVTDSMDLPEELREKAEEIIDDMIYAYELENNCTLDLSELRLDARLEVYLDSKGNWTSIILAVISGSTVFDDIWIEREYAISRDDPLYNPFKTYFMDQIERNLFKQG